MPSIIVPVVDWNRCILAAMQYDHYNITWKLLHITEVHNNRYPLIVYIQYK